MTHQPLRALPMLGAALLALAGCGGGGGGGGGGPNPPPPPPPAAQTIAFADAGPVARTFGDAAFTNAASGGTGTGAITYGSGTAAVATVNSSTGAVTIVSAGTTLITATKAADASHLSAQASYTLNVSKAAQVIAFDQVGPLSRHFGDAAFTNVAAGGNGVGSITYASGNPAVATVNATNGLVAIVGGGTAQITATKAADTNYLAAQASVTLNVLPSLSLIVFPQAGTLAKTYGDPPFAILATGGGTISYASNDPLVLAVNTTSGTVTITGAGSATITATRAADNNYIAAQASYQVNVARAAQTIVFAQIGVIEKHTVDPPFTNLASGGGGTGAITYVSDNTAVATVNAATGTVTVIAAGQAHITATKAQDANYLAAQASYTLTVTQSGALLGFTAWLGADDTEVQFDAAAAGNEFLRGNFPTCGSPLLNACPSAVSTLLGTAQVTDTVSRYDLWTQYWLQRANVAYPAVQVSRSRFPALRNAQMVEFDSQLWMVGAPPNASTWSSYDGRSWVMRGMADAYGPRRGHRATAFANRLWVIGGYKTTAPTGNVSDVWSSPDGVNWTLVNAAAPFQARDSHGLVAYNGRLWVVGGQQSDSGGYSAGSFNDVWSSPDGVTWTRATPAAPFSVRKPQLVVFNNRLWVVGGHEGPSPRSDAWSSTDGVNWTQAGSAVILGTAEGLRATVLGSRLYITGAEYSDYHRQKVFYTDTGNSWTYASINLPFGRRDESAFFSFRNRIWLIGGDSPIQQICCLRGDVWSSPNGADWTYEHTSAPYSPANGQTLVEFANRLWLLGPGNDGVTNVWSSTDGNDWVKSADASNLPRRQWTGIAAYAGRLWMIGGLEGDSGNSASFKNDVWSSTDGNTWTQVAASSPFSARYAHSLFTLNGRLYLAGGVEAPPYERKADVWWTVDGINWTLVTNNAAFGPRYEHQTVNFNGRIWLVGGTDSNNQMPGDVWSTSDGVNWRQDVISNQLLRRYEHQLTVFNGKLWVTAGRDPSYAPSRDLVSSVDGINWTAEPTPPWGARSSHAVAAFGTHMFLFGGISVPANENLENEMWRTDDGIHWRLRHHNIIPVP